MILFIYKIDNIRSELLNKSSHNIDFKFLDNNQLKGIVHLDNHIDVKFIINFTSNFLYIFANKKFYKRKAFNCLYNFFNQNIKLFSPFLGNERKMICDSYEKNLKFIHENNIVYDDELTNKFCENSLDDDYYFFEADLTFYYENNKYNFLYYGDAIKVKNDSDDYLNNVINIFERYMVI